MLHAHGTGKMAPLIRVTETRKSCVLLTHRKRSYFESLPQRKCSVSLEFNRYLRSLCLCKYSLRARRREGLCNARTAEQALQALGTKPVEASLVRSYGKYHRNGIVLFAPKEATHSAFAGGEIGQAQLGAFRVWLASRQRSHTWV